MTQVQLQMSPPPRPSGHGRLIAVGVFAACALGVGLGLWARPASPGGEDLASSVRPDASAAPAQALQIIVDDEPAPIQSLLEVLPGRPAAPRADTAQAPMLALPPAPPRPAEPLVSRTASAGLMKVDAPVVAVLPAVPVIKADSKPPPKSAATPMPSKAKAVEAIPSTPARRVAARPANAQKVAAASPAKAVSPARSAKAEPPKPAQLAKVESGHQRVATPQAKPTRPVSIRSAKPPQKQLPAETRQVTAKKSGQLAQAKPKAAKAAPAKPAAGKAVAEKAILRKPVVRKSVVENAAPPKAAAAPTKVARKPAPVVKAADPRPVASPAKHPAAKRATPRGEGPMRVARANTCNTLDAGEAAACANPRLSLRERELQQAYRAAEAAGVPASALRRQQELWRLARAATARYAPWAVEDVYEARISVLNGQTHDAGEKN